MFILVFVDSELCSFINAAFALLIVVFTVNVSFLSIVTIKYFTFFDHSMLTSPILILSPPFVFFIAEHHYFGL